MDWNFGNYKVEQKVRLCWYSTGSCGGKREEQEKNDGRWTVDYLSMGSESNVIDGASGKESRQRKKSNTPHGNEKQWKTQKQKEGVAWNGYGNNKDWNTGRRSREAGRIKIGKMKHWGIGKGKEESEKQSREHWN